MQHPEPDADEHCGVAVAVPVAARDVAALGSASADTLRLPPPRRPVHFSIVPADAVRSKEHKCNTCNLWPEGQRPWNYDQVCDLYNFSRWAFASVAPTVGVAERPRAVPLHLGDCTWVAPLAAQYHAFGRLTSAMQDAIDAAVDRDKGVIDAVLASFSAGLEGTSGSTAGGATLTLAPAPAAKATAVPTASPPFVRGEACSLKYGRVKGTLCRSRFHTLAQILEALITAPLDHTPLPRRGSATSAAAPLTLWCLPWLDIQDEFRVFVHNYVACAMSQQAWHEPRPEKLGRSPSLDLALRMAHAAEQFVTAAGLANAAVDVAVLATGDVYIVEANPFGPMFSSGSSLFEWHRDADLLHGTASGTHGAPCPLHVATSV